MMDMKDYWLIPNNSIYEIEKSSDGITKITFSNYEQLSSLDYEGKKKNTKKVSKTLPTKYIINEGATILFWKDGTKTIVRKTKKDKFNKKLSFLIAYFQKNSGLSKTQANKYLDSLKDENELKFLELSKLYEEK